MWSWGPARVIAGQLQDQGAQWISVKSQWNPSEIRVNVSKYTHYIYKGRTRILVSATFLLPERVDKQLVHQLRTGISNCRAIARPTSPVNISKYTYTNLLVLRFLPLVQCGFINNNNNNTCINKLFKLDYRVQHIKVRKDVQTERSKKDSRNSTFSY
jgi:hypothetical protein